MVFSLFRSRDVKPHAEKVKRRSLPVYNEIVRGLDEMERQGCDRLVLTLYESEPDPTVRGRWISGEETRYYPFEMLDEAEQEAIRAHQHYTIVSLVRDDVGGIRDYPNRGLEVSRRTAINPLLSPLIPESNLRYATRIGGYIGKDALIRFLCESEANKSWSPEAIEQRVEAGIKEYRETTKRLMREHGVYDTLEKMEQGEYTPFEQIMTNMRSRIDKASKNGGN